MIVTISVALLAQNPLMESIAARRGFVDCLSHQSQDQLMAGLAPDKFATFVATVCRDSRDAYVKAEIAASGKDADPAAIRQETAEMVEATVADYRKKFAAR